MDDHQMLQRPSDNGSRKPSGSTAFPETVIDMITQQAQRTPERIALAWGGGPAWTYARLLEEANAIACCLVERGVARGELVGISVPRRPEMVAAVLGVLRAGAAYLPLDPVYPAERIRYMAEHAGIHHVLVWHDDEATAALPAEVRRFALEGFDPRSAPPRTLPTPRDSDLAYVLYTSGSTGKPKGVRILHGNLVNFLVSMRDAPGINATDVLCAGTTLSFDIAALELYLPLMVGARIVIASEAEQIDPATLARMMQVNGVTVFQTTPTALRMVFGNDHGGALANIKVLVGGEALPRDLARALLPACRELWNMYGPTETTVWSTIHKMAEVGDAVPLGKPIANTTIYILDENHARLADGAVGEIWIGGAGVADGYLHDPERTAERFVPDPFAADGSRMYRTGDLGSLRDGVLHFHGRADDQIKLRGFRIEPGDIEAAAMTRPGIEHAVAVAREITEGDTRLVLYVVAKSADPAMLQPLRDTLRERLPAYMRPQHIEVLADLPRTPNGKIDRKALPVPAAISEPQRASAASTPDRLESAILAIWHEVLKVQRIGLHDDFFELGGDSLLAVRVFERMQALTGVNLPLATLLAAPTVAGQVAAFRAAGARDPDTTGAATPSGDRDPWSPLVPLQPHGSRPPLFLIHAIGGNVLNYAPLARGLGADQPVYGIQAIGLDGNTPPVGSLQTMAACYTAEIQRLQPHGPYFLGGGSMGGLIAYEIAQQLREQGESVALLAMMDTHGPDWRSTKADLWKGLVQRFATALIERPRRLFDGLRVRRARRHGKTLPHALRYREIERVHYRALLAYAPQSYPGQVVLFLGSDRPSGAPEDATLGWGGRVEGGIVVIELPGNHDNLIERPELVRELRAQLRRRQQPTGP